MKKIKSLFKKHGARIGALAMCFMLLIPMLCSADGSDSVTVNFYNSGNIPQNCTVSIGEISSEGTEVSVGNTYHIPYNSVLTTSNGYIDIGDGVRLPVPYGDGTYAVFTCTYSNQTDDISEVVIDSPLAAYTYELDGAVFEYFVCDVINLSLVDVHDSAPGFGMHLIFVPVEVTPPDYVSPITDVWSSITNWVISSLNTVQGVFYGAGEEVFTPDTTSSDTLIYDDVLFYPFDFQSTEEAGGGRAFLNGVEIFEDGFSQTVTTINGEQYVVVSNNGVPILLMNTSTQATFAPVGLEIIVQTDGALTLLGTLAVIGLSISLAFLLIGIIQRFLKLRG